MDPRGMPTAADYAWADAQAARRIAEGNAEKDAASRAELERQILVLRGQVSFLTGFVIDLVKGSGEWYLNNDMDLLEKIKENNW